MLCFECEYLGTLKSYLLSVYTAIKPKLVCKAFATIEPRNNISRARYGVCYILKGLLRGTSMFLVWTVILGTELLHRPPKVSI